MKLRIKVILVLCVVFSAMLSNNGYPAAVDWGVKFGMQRSGLISLLPQSYVEFETVPKFIVGAFQGIRLFKGFYLQPELYYLKKGASYGIFYINPGMKYEPGDDPNAGFFPFKPVNCITRQKQRGKTQKHSGFPGITAKRPI